MLALDTDSESDESKPYLKDRETLSRYAAKMVSSGKTQEYQQECNNRSLDGLPGLQSALRDGGNPIWRLKLENWLNQHRDEVKTVKVLALLLIAILMGLKWHIAI